MAQTEVYGLYSHKYKGAHDRVMSVGFRRIVPADTVVIRQDTVASEYLHIGAFS